MDDISGLGGIEGNDKLIRRCSRRQVVVDIPELARRDFARGAGAVEELRLRQGEGRRRRVGHDEIGADVLDGEGPDGCGFAEVVAAGPRVERPG